MSLRRSFRRRHHRAPRIRSRRQIVPSFLVRLNWSRGALLAGTSAIALALTGLHPTHAMQVGNSGAGTSAVTIAAQQAQQAAQQAQQAGQAASQALTRASHALQSMQAIQAAARAAAQAAQSSATLPNVSVPNGIGTGGLLPNNPGTWTGAKAPTQSVDSSGQTNVTVDQTQAQAILNWTTFNIGSKTTLTFDQQGNSNWVALNRVDASTGPSQILGNIKADGIVLVINQSGIIFGGGSQINVGSLVASSANITDAQFLASGIYSTQNGSLYIPSFTGAGQGTTGGLGGKIIVEAGAQITTNAPTSVSSGGGYVLMMGTEVDNAGSISTPMGQTELAAGQDFILRSGFGSDSNQFSTTRGNEIAIATDTANGGIVDNTGLIFAQQGDITLAGHNIIQDGILLSTTSVNQRGTIHLLNSATDTTGRVTLTANSVTEVVPELDSTATALDSQRDALIASAGVNTLATGQFNDLSTLADRPDQSRIEIVTGGVIDFQNGSLTQAQGGQVAASAGQQVFVESGATIDVSGVQNVVLPMSANEILVNIQGNELRDSPGNRDNSALLNGNVWIDVRDLILVPAGTGGYATDRYYTPGGLLEVSGYLSNTGHTIGEWDAVGGTITLSAPQVVAQKGSTFNISGGSLQYQGGYIIDSTLVGSDGQVYNIDDAPTDLTYAAGGNGFVVNHSRAGIVDTYSNLVGGIKDVHYEDGYTVGRSAGQLILSTPTAVFEGDVVADVTTGSRQTSAAPAGVTDGYKYTQDTVPLAGTMALGTYGATGLTGGAASTVVFGSAPAVDISGLSAGDALPTGVANTAYFDANQINAEHLGGVSIASANSITVDASLVFAAGGQVSLVAPIVDIKADVTVPSGSVTVTNILVPGAAGASRTNLQTRDGQAMLTLEDGATIDVSGVWTNELFGSSDPSTLAFANGGNVTFDSTQSVNVAAGSKIDVSSGAAISQTGKTTGGKGGNVTLVADDPFNNIVGTGTFTFGGAINAVGVNGGGTLTIKSGQGILIGDAGSTPANPGDLVLPSDYFDKGFSNYDITGTAGVTVADGAQIQVVEPVYQFTSDSFAAPSGADPSAVLKVWLPPLFTEDPLNGTLTQRAGASLALRTVVSLVSGATGESLTVGHGASITVDPGQSITLDGANQVTIDGTLTARGGTINILNETLNDFDTSGNVLGHTLWIGGDATLDVSGLATTAQDIEGRAYGIAQSGGSIQLSAGSSFLVIRPGAVLDADGASATIDANAGANPSAGSDPFTLAGNGGSISLTSSANIYNDGTMEAHAGGANAAGGTFSIGLGEAGFTVIGGGAPPPGIPQDVSVITVTQGEQGSGLPDDLTPGSILSAASNGHTTVSADGLAKAGFDNLSFSGADVLQFDGNVTLKAGQSISFTNSALSDTLASGHVTIDAPYVLFAGHTGVRNDGGPQGFLSQWKGSTTATQAEFDVNANLIDFKADTYFGVSGTVGGVSYDFLGFQNVDFTSQGDVRFLINPASGDGSPPPATRIFTPGNLTFTAAQLYPVTGAQAFIVAGAVDTGTTGVPTTSTSSLTINRISDVDPGVPMSVFGQIYLLANDIYQGGIVRAPLGVIDLGAAGVSPFGSISLTTQVVDIKPGSITSVSADGLTIPYGGTTDGLSYLYAGGAVNPMAFGTGGGRVTQGISIASASVDVEAGATLDLSGGGDLTGHGFISGRGGSVDVLKTPLVNSNPTDTFSSAGDKVYAIVPSYGSGYAPIAADNGAGDPMVGQQITIPAGVPGLPAGTYTLLPSTYALLPGAFRVEVGGSVSPALASFGGALGNGSYSIAGYEGIANTSIKNTLPTRFIITAADDVRNYSQYDEMSYSDFFVANAATFGQVQPLLPQDAKALLMSFVPKTAGDTTPSLIFDGTASFQPAPGGFSGTVAVTVGSTAGPDLEIYAPGAGPTAGFSGVSIDAAALDALKAPQLVIGGGETIQGTTVASSSDAGSIFVRAGVTLSGGQVVLTARNNITVEQDATISTIGQGPAPYALSDGFVYSAGSTTLFLSNAEDNFLGTSAGGAINIAAGASLYSEGTLAFVTNGPATIDSAAHYGTKVLELAAASINIGDGAALGATVPDGISFDQALFDRLVAGASAGAPAGVPGLEQLVLGASKSINFYGTTGFDASGTDIQLVLTTPAIYGYGTAGDHASIKAGTLVWSGASNATLPTIGAGTPGSGTGTLDVIADTIILGYSDAAVPNNQVSLDRATYGFSTVNLTASTEIISNNQGSLSVYLAPSTDPHAVLGKSGTGGDLNITTPLLTGTASSIMAYTAGGSLNVTAPTGATPPQATGALGAEIDLTGSAVNLDTNVLLPSGKLVVTANVGDITIGAGAQFDLSGKPTTIEDQTVYGFGGDVILTSAHGNITQDAGSTIDVSAVNNDAGTITATATDAAAGKVALNGTLRGGSTMSSGVLGSFDGGFITISAQTLQSGDAANLSSDFAALNNALNTAGFSGSRAFDFKQGNLTVGDGVQAHQVAISVDGGSLTVTGTIDASGATPGSIRLAARDDLTLASTAVLDAHGTQLQVDSNGQPIAADNKATIELTTTEGTLTLSPGATIDMRVTDPANVAGIGYGEFELNAPRIGTASGTSATGSDGPTNATDDSIAVSATGPLNIEGASSIALNGFATYNNAPVDPNDTNGQIINQAWLDLINQDNQAFIANIYGGNVAGGQLTAALQAKIAGLLDAKYSSVFHVRPGVEIDSKTPNGNLTVSGDINLANYRYGPNATGNGSGEPGVLILRAGGNLNINGSITDGFGTPPNTPDDFGWLVMAGGAIGPSGLTLTQSVTLGTGTTFNTGSGSTLSFALPIQGGSWPAGTPTAKALTLAQDITLPSGTVLTVALRGPGTLAAGTTLTQDSGELTQNVVLQADWTIDPNSAYGQYVDNVLGGIDVLDANGNLLPPIFAGTKIDKNDILPANDPFMVFTAGFTIPANVFPSGLPVIITNPAGSKLTAPLTLTAGTVIPAGMVFPTKAFITGGTMTAANVALPTQVTLAQSYTLDAPLTLTGNITTPTGTIIAGTTLDVGTVLPVGTVIGAGTTLPFEASIDSMTWPANTPLTFAGTTVSPGQNFTLGAGAFIPGGSDLLSANGSTQLTRQGQIWAIAPMLPAGSLSWSMRLVAGADLTSADTRALQSMSALAGAGNLTLDDPHVAAAPGNALVFSVLRTGTGDLDLLAGGNFSEESPFGVYTAGTQSADVGPNGVDTFNRPRGTVSGLMFADGIDPGYASAVDAAYQAWYPQNGGDLLLSAQGNVSGYINPRNGATGQWVDSANVENWLWRKADADGANAAWWINFGSYVLESQFDAAPVLTGFTGIGTLGGGNLTVIAGSNAGTLSGVTNSGLNLAVASTGRALANGTVEETGGGTMTLRIGGTLNPAPPNIDADADLNGALTDLRGNIDVKAGAIGIVTPNARGGNNVDPADPRPLDYRQFEMSTDLGGITIMPGDGTVNIGTRGDLVIDGAGDAGMLAPVDGFAGIPYISGGQMTAGGGDGRFTLWTATTAINLYSAGGNVSPGAWSGNNSNGPQNVGDDLYPPTLNVAAASGSIYFFVNTTNNSANTFFELMPAANGQLSLLAGNSIYGEGDTIAMSGADPASLATPTHAVFQQFQGGPGTGNSSPDSAFQAPANISGVNPIAFGPDTPTTNLHVDDTQPSLVYAGNDIVDLGIGLVKTLSPDIFGTFNPQPTTWYYAAEPFEIIAGRDIVGGGIPRGSLSPVVTDVILNNNPNDISVIRAGRDILYGAATIAGPGLLDVEAGRNFYAGPVGSLHSVGPLVDVDPSNRSSGAGIVLMAGVGPNGPDYTDFAKLYFNPANQLPTDGTPLDGSGKVVHTYDQELLAWLQQRFGYTGSSADALSYFLSLPVEQQGVFVRQVYYEELTLGGREESGAIASPRLGSYLRGREAIATLFPDTDANGQPINYTGTITMFSGQAFYTGVGNIDSTFHSGDSTRTFDAGIHTDFGGDIQILNPGGQTIVGVEGFLPGADAGLITQGSGNIDIYSLSDLLLGQSRIMTTFGGDILAWSAEGDINAGRGSKTTTVFTPPRRVYDDYGNVTLSPTVPSQGAGIATLNPIPEVPPGDIDLIAPLGTIDAGEAGIRVSGNVNLAALQIVNAANIQVQGTSTGLPTVSGPPVGALTAASNVVGAGQQLVPTTQANNNQPSVMIVEIIGYGGSQSSDQSGSQPSDQSGSQPSDQNSDDPKKCSDPKNDDCKQP